MRSIPLFTFVILLSSSLFCGCVYIETDDLGRQLYWEPLGNTMIIEDACGETLYEYDYIKKRGRTAELPSRCESTENRPWVEEE